MLKNENIICISSIDWDFVWQGHQEIMSTFAKKGNRVLFIENTGIRSPGFKDIPRLKKRIVNWLKSVKGFRKVTDNLFVYSPLLLPFPYSRLARLINKHLLLKPLLRWMKATEFHSPIIWTFLPTGIALDIINAVDTKLLVYYYIADFDVLADNLKKLKVTEGRVIKRCDIIFAQGRVLADKCKGSNENVFIFPFGVNTTVFENFLQRPSVTLPEDLKNVKKPVIGYVGGIHKHVDTDLLLYMAKAHPEWSIVLVGPVQTDISRLKDIKNIISLGQKNFVDLPVYINSFDICIIPYVVSDYTKTVYPTKLNEYHMMGKPVVSTYMPEVASFNETNNDLVGIANTYEEFVALIKRSMKSDNAALAKARVESARKSSWSERIEGMSALMEKAMDRKKGEHPINWQERFLALYENTKSGMVKAAVAALLLWLLVFYTPFVWMIAEPLKIAEAPVKADCIIVFGGGVGESGKAGQGYEERVGYAVDLYKRGYADHLIFSSGYQYHFNETLLMKALAVALGVPEKAIILEARAANTYENVKFTKAILDKEGWKKALVVSSPYNMRRASLVFDRLGKDITVVYTPLLNSTFYLHAKAGLFNRRTSVRQIRGIMHEYMGILYYQWKKWI